MSDLKAKSLAELHELAAKAWSKNCAIQRHTCGASIGPSTLYRIRRFTAVSMRSSMLAVSTAPAAGCGKSSDAQRNLALFEKKERF